ncbi:MAG: glycosyltransferase [Bacteroidetes bacterium]|nr:glycosyltransferase [Bacteroidota bacterium]
MKIFILLSRFPYPLEKGDKLRAYHQIRHLAKNHEIHLCALNDIHIKAEHRTALDPFCKSVHVINLSKAGAAWNIFKAFISGMPLQVGYFFNHSAKKKINQLINEIQPDHIYCQLIRVTEYVKDRKITKTLDYQDVFSKGVDRRSQSAPFYMKPVLRSEYRRLLKYEHDIFSKFDHKTIISVPDRDLIPHPEKGNIEVVINGVDTDFFSPMEMKKEYDLVFTGNMGYPPNVNAAIYLAKEILPEVRRKHPNVTLMLAGATPSPGVLLLKSKNIEVTGWVDDIRECYAKARVFIAPMQIGTGLQNKLLEAMAMKIPSITSDLANNALKATNGKEILVGNSAREFADHIIHLLDNPDFAAALGEKGHDFVHQKYNWASATQKLENLMTQS